MSDFWCGYAAGLISVMLPSLVFLAVALTRAPDDHGRPWTTIG